MPCGLLAASWSSLTEGFRFTMIRSGLYAPLEVVSVVFRQGMSPLASAGVSGAQAALVMVGFVSGDGGGNGPGGGAG